MRSRKVMLGLACLSASAGLFVGTAHADRRSGLAGNLLIEDPDDLFPFPQYTLVHRNMIRLDYAGGNAGNGVLTLGDDNMAYGVALHRGDILNPDTVGIGQELVWTGGVGDPFADGGPSNGTSFSGPAITTRRPAGVMQGAPGEATAAAAGAPVPATVFDLVVGGRLTGTSMWGARAGFGRGVQVVDNDGEKVKGATNFVAVQGGFSSVPEDGLRLDLSGNIVAGIGKQTQLDAGGDEEDVASGLDLRVGLLARGYSPINDIVDLGFLGNLSFNYETISIDEPAEVGQSDMGVGLFFGAGPSIHLDRAKIAAYGGLLAAYGSSEPNDELDDDEFSRLHFAVPVINMATEVQLLDWMYVRTGAQYSWEVKKDTVNDQGNKVGGGNFLWSAGLGVTKANFFFDGVLSNGFVTNGPAFVGGPGAGFLVLASATYKFGDVLSGQVPAAEPETSAEPAAAPVSEPAPAVEPDQEASAPAVDTTGTTSATGAADGTSATGSAGASGSINIGN
jgi:hypothetical protein